MRQTKQGHKGNVLYFYILFLFLVNLTSLRADGTRNFIAPVDTIGNGLSWQNEACMYLFNATEANPYLGTVEAEADERFYINIQDPATEKIYLGFNVSQSNYASTDLHFRVKAPDGTIVQDYTEVPSSGAGYISSYKSIYEGPSPTVTSGGYTPIVVTPLSGQSGDYYIEFNNVGYGETLGYTPSATNYIVTFQFFDISVGETSASPSGQKTHDLVEGRFFAYQFPMTNYHDRSQLNYDGVDFDYYIYHHTDKVTTKLHWDKVVGGGWIIMFNDHGPTDTGDLSEDRKSNSSNSYSLATPKYRIFFAQPDETVYETTDTEPVFAYEEYRWDCESGQRAFFFNINRSGRLEMLMEFGDGYDNGYFDPNTSDRILIVEDVTVNRNKVLWDGLDGNGTSRASATFTINMSFSIGSLNNPMFDVEQVMGGIQAELIAPAPATFGWTQYPKVYYDDEDINNLGRYDYDGSSSLTHIFPYYSYQRGDSRYNYGDQVWINSWWTAHEEEFSETISVSASPGIIPVDTIWGADPGSCSSSDGEIYIEGLIGGDSYSVVYDKDGVTQSSASYTADGNGVVTIAGLSPGDYDAFLVSSGACNTSDNTTLISLSCVDANDAVLSCQTNPGGTAMINVPSSNFSGAPYAANTLTHLSIITFPANANAITIGSTTYNSQAELGSGVEVTTNTSGNPTQSISVDPNDDVASVVVYYRLKDNQGTYSGEAQVTVPFPNMTLSADVTTTACDGGSSGELDLTVFDGTAPYSFLWTPGNYTSEDITGLLVGQYTVEVTDADGCSVVDSFEVTSTPITGTCNITEETPPEVVSTSVEIDVNASAISGTGWNDLDRLVLDDGSYGNASIGRRSYSGYIYANTFDFSEIPNNATILGLELTIDRYASGNRVRDNVIQFDINGSVGNNVALTGTDWPTSAGSQSYGNSTDLWGFAEITRSDLNDLELQLRLYNSRNSTRQAYIDYVALRVYYSVPSAYVDNVSYTFSINAADYPEASGFSWSVSRSALVESVSPDGTTATINLNNRGGGDYEICVTPYNDCETATPCCTTITVVNDGGGVSILGTVFADVDLDGNYETGDPGVDSVQVLLYEDNDGDGSVSVGDVQINSKYTDSLGNYFFDVFPTFIENNVRDEFSTGDYTGNDGSENWSGNWVVDDPTYVYVSGGEFVFHYIWSENAYREVDLSGYTNATLSFDWRSVGLDSGEELDVEISSDGGSNYTSLATFGYSPTSGTFSQDISAYIASNTRIRFINNTANWESGEYVYVDNLNIVYSSGNGDYVMELASATLPYCSTLTTDNVEVANFSASDVSDPDNNFGIALADLEVSKTDGLDTLFIGDGTMYSYTLEVTNNGPTNATNVVVAESWPSDFVQEIIGTPSAGTIGGTAPDFTWNMATIALGQTENLQVSYTVPAAIKPAEYSNRIMVTSDNDPLIANDTAWDVSLVVDTVSPWSTSCPSNVSGLCDTLYDPQDPVFTDNCALESVKWIMSGATVDTSAQSGFNYIGTYDFNTGTTIITYTATDSSGNSGQCTFTIDIDLPTLPSVTVNGPLCAGEDAVFSIEGTAGNVISFEGDTSGRITIGAGGTEDLVVANVYSDVILCFTKVDNGTCSTSFTLFDTVVVSNSRPVAYDGFSDNAYGWDDGLSSSNWTQGANPTLFDIGNTSAAMVYEHAASGIYVNGGSDYLYNNTATNGAPNSSQSKYISRTPADSLGKTFYISFLARFSAAHTSTWSYLAVGKKDNTDDNGAALGRLGGSNRRGAAFADNGAVMDIISGETVADQTYFVVGKWTVDTSGVTDIDMWVNPTSLTTPQGEYHNQVHLGSVDDDMNSIDIQSFFDDTTYFDEIRYGFSWEAVVPHHTLISSDEDNSINSGESVTFTAYGGGEYEFFLNNSSMQARSTTATYATSSLADQDVVKVKVYHENACDIDSAEIIMTVGGADYGDAPASYDAGGAACHMFGASPQLYLGTVSPDDEIDALSSLGVSDDTTGVDDEDAFAYFPPYTTMRSSYTLHVPLTNTSGDSVTVAAWIDMDADGSFELDERASKTIPAGKDTATLVWNALPIIHEARSTYIRIRMASDKTEIDDATGVASDGEVEDYPFEIYYAGDCPTEAFLVQDDVANWYDLDLATATYTLANDNHSGKINGVGYNMLDGLIYGYENTNKNGYIAITSVNANTSPSTYTTYFVGPIPGLPTGTGFYVGDVGNGDLYLRSGGADVMYIIDVDPDSPTYLGNVRSRSISGDGGATYTDMVYLPSDNMIYALDNKTGDLHQINPTTGVTTNIYAGSVPKATYGAQYLDVNGFMYASDNASGDIYRVSLTGNPDYEGVLWAIGPASSQNDGSRCPMAPVPIDFGDAPDSYITEVSYGTQIGARHAVPLYNDVAHTAPLMIGSHVDVEIDGQPGQGADGDDVSGFDDEDGFSDLPALSTVSTSYALSVDVMNNTGGEVYLSAYIDFDKDSLFNDDERVDAIISSSSASLQTVNLNWTGIGTTIDINPGTSYLRLRLSSVQADVQVPNGIAMDGEVEDHELVISGIQTDSVTRIEETTATYYGYLWAGNDIEEYGFYYSTDNDVSKLVEGTAQKAQVYSGVAVDVDSVYLSYDVSSLTNRSAYYFRAFMKDADDNYFYGNVVRFVSEKRDFSLLLDGDGDCVVVDEFYTDSLINDWGGANTFSVDFWMKKNSTSTARQVLIQNYAATAGYTLALNNGYVSLESHSGASVLSALQITDEDWHHLALTYNNGIARIYIDDSVSGALSLTLAQAGEDANCFIGAGYTGAVLEDEFNGHLDAMRFWNVTLTSEQVSELLYDIVEQGAGSAVMGVGSGKVINALNWNNLIVSLAFNVKSTEEAIQDFSGALNYENQQQLHNCPFFHSDARLGADSVSFNLVAFGNAKPSPYLPRAYWRYDNTNVVWQSADNWSGFAYPGEGASAAQYPDVASSDMENDSAYCKYTIVSGSSSMATVTTTPPQVQVLVDRDENIGTYYVDDTNSELWIMQGIRPVIFGQRVEDEEGAIVIEEGAMEVFH